MLYPTELRALARRRILTKNIMKTHCFINSHLFNVGLVDGNTNNFVITLNKMTGAKKMSGKLGLLPID